MPDLDLIKQGEQAVRDRRGRFAGGRSGNPAGRPHGCRDHVDRATRSLLAGEGAAPTRKSVELALAGDPRASRPLRVIDASKVRHRSPSAGGTVRSPGL
jgi:hypothetical protein